MSFLGGPECSTGANPLAQFQKQSSADTSLQRDRLTQRQPQLNGFRNQQLPDDAQFQEFQQQGPGFNEQLPQDANYQQQLFLLEQQQQQQARAGGGDGWAGEFAQQPPTFSPEQFAQQQGRNGAFSPQDFSNFRQQQMSPASRQAQTPVPQQQSLYQRPPMYGSTFGGSGFGMQRPMMFQPQQPMYGQQPQEQYQGKGKGRIQELSDTDWEEQFKELSTVDKEGELDQLDADAEQAIEAELNQMDRYATPLPFDLASCDPALTLHCGVGGQHGNKMVRDAGFGEFEDIWQGYQAEANVVRDMLGDEGHMGEYDEWKDFDGMSHDFDGLRTFENRGPESSNYLFEENNLFDDVPNAFEEGLKIMREGGSLSLAALAFEAAVQKQPEMVEAWVALGSAQAQNEKESPAIRAMEQALKLDSNNLDALMGLSVSYTNEGYDSLAYRTLERWVSVKYPQLGLTPQGLDEAAQAEEEMGFTDRHQLHEKVTALFLEAAQLNPEGMDVDIDVQVGLGVLFYGSEDYDKAVDCFNAALDSAETGTMKREGEEHLLWNRLGATLANSGRSEEAIEAYSRALELRSNFVRARYNLGVSCINLGVLEQAAGHLLGALSMHRVIEREGRMKAAELLRDGNGNAVDDREVEGLLQQNQSTNLYDTLRRVFTQMDRRDLSEGEESESVSQPQAYVEVLRGDVVSDTETAKARWAIPNAAGGFDFADSISPPQKSLRRLSSDILSGGGGSVVGLEEAQSKVRHEVGESDSTDLSPSHWSLKEVSSDTRPWGSTDRGEMTFWTDAPVLQGEGPSAATNVHQQTGEETDELGALYQRVVELRHRVYGSQSDDERNAAMAELLEQTGRAVKVKAMEDDVKEIVSHMKGEGSAQAAVGSDNTGRAAGKQATTNSIMSMPELAAFMPPNMDLLSFQESDHMAETADQDDVDDVMPGLQTDRMQDPAGLQALSDKYDRAEVARRKAQISAASEIIIVAEVERSDVDTATSSDHNTRTKQGLERSLQENHAEQNVDFKETLREYAMKNIADMKGIGETSSNVWKQVEQLGAASYKPVLDLIDRGEATWWLEEEHRSLMKRHSHLEEDYEATLEEINELAGRIKSIVDPQSLRDYDEHFQELKNWLESQGAIIVNNMIVMRNTVDRFLADLKRENVHAPTRNTMEFAKYVANNYDIDAMTAMFGNMYSCALENLATLHADVASDWQERINVCREAMVARSHSESCDKELDIAEFKQNVQLVRDLQNEFGSPQRPNLIMDGQIGRALVDNALAFKGDAEARARTAVNYVDLPGSIRDYGYHMNMEHQALQDLAAQAASRNCWAAEASDQQMSEPIEGPGTRFSEESLSISATDVESRAEEERESDDCVVDGSNTAALKEKLADLNKQYSTAIAESMMANGVASSGESAAMQQRSKELTAENEELTAENEELTAENEELREELSAQIEALREREKVQSALANYFSKCEQIVLERQAAHKQKNEAVGQVKKMHEVLNRRRLLTAEMRQQYVEFKVRQSTLREGRTSQKPAFLQLLDSMKATKTWQEFDERTAEMDVFIKSTFDSWQVTSENALALKETFEHALTGSWKESVASAVKATFETQQDADEFSTFRETYLDRLMEKTTDRDASLENLKEDMQNTLQSQYGNIIGTMHNFPEADWATEHTDSCISELFRRYKEWHGSTRNASEIFTEKEFQQMATAVGKLGMQILDVTVVIKQRLQLRLDLSSEETPEQQHTRIAKERDTLTGNTMYHDLDKLSNDLMMDLHQGQLDIDQFERALATQVDGMAALTRDGLIHPRMQKLHLELSEKIAGVFRELRATTTAIHWEGEYADLLVKDIPPSVLKKCYGLSSDMDDYRCDFVNHLNAGTAWDDLVPSWDGAMGYSGNARSGKLKL
ncbi:Peroxisomal membrane signal receptor PTS1 [Elasticomyces elasticus]|nr:Peroxisomal membrane signal receptor PTS1 [Elasticomyces elasticus]KAK4932832.1 Peroxisomal membrane signal receptor PTS1 [Elasticomyces elasticus]KAK5768764.1 Peroxisomal membrane signal receptor PTS1 [Elasticomyces elasticus]